MKRLLPQATFNRKKSEDLEKQSQISITLPASDKRMDFIRLLFGVSLEELDQFRGIASYCDYLEKEAFHPLMTPSFDSIQRLMFGASSLHIGDCWDWCLAVLEVIQSEQPEISISDILWKLEEKVKSSKSSSEKSPGKNFIYLAIFGALCWASMMVRPRLTFEDGVGPTLTCLLPDGIKPPKNPQSQKFSDRCMRPVMTAFRSFKLHHWGDQPDERTLGVSAETDSLHVASLNIYSLRYFGHVTIHWVDTISEHLRFNPAKRRLSLFRFPTFCALLAVHGDNICPALRSISEEFEPLSPENRDQCCITLEQEVLLSYRLLFGQDGKSRKLAYEEIGKLKKSRVNQSIDGMLLDLCGRKYEHGFLWWKRFDKVLRACPSDIWPITCRDMEGYLQQNDVYSAQEDFPRLGRRLIKLQQFNMRQKPSRLTDLWRDRRNPLQWYTFWAVVLVGGAANILATLQLLVAIIEVRS